MHRNVQFPFFAVVFFSVFSAPTFADDRAALVIGNSAYVRAPVDARLNDEADQRRMVRVDDVIADMQPAKNLRILVLDSCRDNPLAEQLKCSIGTARSASVGRGLAKIDSPEGMIIAYATQPGRTADDGGGRNSPCTIAWLAGRAAHAPQ